MSRMFSVNSEARETTFSCYWVRFFCWFSTVAGIVKPAILYFNPEHDFLRAIPEWSVKNALFNSRHLMKTIYDSQHISLCNLVVSGNDLRVNDLELIEPLDPDLDEGFREFLRICLKILT